MATTITIKITMDGVTLADAVATQEIEAGDAFEDNTSDECARKSRKRRPNRIGFVTRLR